MSYYDKEMEKLERQQRELREMQEQGQWDRYNTTDKMVDSHDYKKVLNVDLEFSPKKGESWESWFVKAELYADMGAKKSIKAHINGPKGAWWTHRNPQGCFPCEDMNLIRVLINVMGVMVQQYPKNVF